MIEITRDIATKVRDAVDAGLVHGVGIQEPGKMCVEAAVCFALGLPHGDDPGCVSAPLRRLKIRLNDSSWSSNQARANGLRRLAIAQLGSKGVLDDAEFVRRVASMTIRRSVPVCLRRAAKLNPKHAEALEAKSVARTVRAADAAAAYAADAAADAAAYAAYAAAAAAAYNAADAAYAADAAAYAAYAYAAAYAADAADAADAAYAADAYAAYAADAYAASAVIPFTVARSEHYEKMADKLIELLEAA